jgi:hypothetical protein
MPIIVTATGDAGDRASDLRDHAAVLREGELLPPGRMIRESVLYTDMANPKLPTVHRDEGKKFAASAFQLAPPALVAKYIAGLVERYPAVAALDQSNIVDAFQPLIASTNFDNSPPPRGIPVYRYPVSVTRDYFEHTARDPNVFLACFYLSLSLQTYMTTLSAVVGESSKAKGIAAMGKHFDAKNLVTALPVALVNSVIAIHGKSADYKQIDAPVTDDALATLHNNGQFKIEARATSQHSTPNAAVTFQCPMAGYVFELLGKHQTILPIIAAIERTELAITTSLPRPDLLIAYHMKNRDLVMAIAKQALQLFQR